MQASARRTIHVCCFPYWSTCANETTGTVRDLMQASARRTIHACCFPCWSTCANETTGTVRDLMQAINACCFPFPRRKIGALTCAPYKTVEGVRSQLWEDGEWGRVLLALFWPVGGPAGALPGVRRPMLSEGRGLTPIWAPANRAIASLVSPWQTSCAAAIKNFVSGHGEWSASVVSFLRGSHSPMCWLMRLCSSRASRRRQPASRRPKPPRSSSIARFHRL